MSYHLDSLSDHSYYWSTYCRMERGYTAHQLTKGIIKVNNDLELVLIHLRASRALRTAIHAAASQRNTTSTSLFWRGLVKEVPELKDAIVKERL